eukprot:6180080-Pleurochrysis_carterae.AAC.2
MPGSLHAEEREYLQPPVCRLADAAASALRQQRLMRLSLTSAEPWNGPRRLKFQLLLAPLSRSRLEANCAFTSAS